MSNDQDSPCYPGKSRRAFKAISWLLFGSATQKRRVRQELARISASLFGDFPLGDDYKLWLEDKNFRAKFKELSPLSPYSMERKWTLRELARYVENVPGSTAECGCYDGSSAFFIAEALPDVALHLFDSFAGLSNPEAVDIPNRTDERAWQAGDLSIGEEVAKERLSSFPNIHFHKGWIPERFKDVLNETFRLVHIDVDLYQPTKDSLDFFYPRVNAGGIIIFDDYGSKLCPGAHLAITEFLENHNASIVHLTTMQGFLFKT